MWSGSTLYAMTLTSCGLGSKQVDVDRPGRRDVPAAPRAKLRDAARKVRVDKMCLKDKLVLTFCSLKCFFLTGRK